MDKTNRERKKEINLDKTTAAFYRIRGSTVDSRNRYEEDDQGMTNLRRSRHCSRCEAPVKELNVGLRKRRVLFVRQWSTDPIYRTDDSRSEYLRWFLTLLTRGFNGLYKAH